MLAMAIKNSMILALVIMIAHFLLKSTGEDRMYISEKNTLPLNISPSEDRDVVAAASADDLYSYVYGAPESSVTSDISMAMATSMPLTPSPLPSPAVPCPPPTPASVPPSGMLMGYEANLAEQWCML